MSNVLLKDIEFHELRLGLRLLDHYVRYDTKMRFVVEIGEFEGLSGALDYTGLRRTKVLSYNSLTDESKREYQDRVARSKFCTIVEYAEGYKVNTPIKILDLYGTTHWTTFTELKRRKPLGVQSRGEFLIKNLLVASGIEFTTQHKIVTTLGNQFLDFYLPKMSVAIEYQGIQHYRNVPYFSKSLDEQKLYDQEKKNYCTSHGIQLIEVPYYVEKTQDIINVLHDYGLPVASSYKEHKTQLTTDTIIEYYKHHTKQETAEHFNIPKYSVQKIAVSRGFRKKGSRPKNYQDEDVLALYIDKGLSRKHVAHRLGISVATVTNVAKRHGYSKSSRGVITKN